MRSRFVLREPLRGHVPRADREVGVRRWGSPSRFEFKFWMQATHGTYLFFSINRIGTEPRLIVGCKYFGGGEGWGLRVKMPLAFVVPRKYILVAETAMGADRHWKQSITAWMQWGMKLASHVLLWSENRSDYLETAPRIAG